MSTRGIVLLKHEALSVLLSPLSVPLESVLLLLSYCCRSTEDEYTPSHQVEALQRQVLHMLTSTLQSKADHTHKGGMTLMINYDYVEEGDDSASESTDQTDK